MTMTLMKPVSTPSALSSCTIRWLVYIILSHAEFDESDFFLLILGKWPVIYIYLLDIYTETLSHSKKYWASMH